MSKHTQPRQVTRVTYEVWYLGANGHWTYAIQVGSLEDATTRAERYRDKGTRAIVSESTRRPVYDTADELTKEKA